MNGRFFIRVVAVLVLVAVVAGLGVSAYNAGVAAGVNQAVQQAVQNGQPVPVVPYAYGPYWHGGGFGFFGIFFWIIGFFLIIGLLRAAFGMGRWGGGWGRGGHGPGRMGGPGAYFGRGEQIADWHRELHRRDESGGADTGAGRPPAGT